MTGLDPVGIFRKQHNCEILQIQIRMKLNVKKWQIQIQWQIQTKVQSECTTIHVQRQFEMQTKKQI